MQCVMGNTNFTNTIVTQHPNQEQIFPNYAFFLVQESNPLLYLNWALACQEPNVSHKITFVKL